MKQLLFIALAGSCLSVQTLHAQQPSKAVVKLNKPEVTIVNRAYVADDKGMHLDARDGAGIAWLNKIAFTTGEIELDIQGKDVFQQSFVGIAFHGVNDSTYESVYFRPFNFKAADSVRRVHAVQYIAMPLYDWPTLRSEHPGKYEKPLEPAPDPNAWFHVRLAITEDRIKIYVNGSQLSALEVAPLTKEKGKKIGLWAGNGSAGSWRNLTIRATP